MNNKIKAAMAAMALGASALTLSAQDAGGPPPDNSQPPMQQPPPGPGGPGRHGHHPPAPAIVRALDANHDGVIDAQEIANASAVLKTLDKNGDGVLTPDEFMGPPPPSEGGTRPPEDTPSAAHPSDP